MALNSGSRLGRYVIVRQLGAGAMGEVYLAEDPHIERRVAIKTVRVDLHDQVSDATRDQLRLRFEREAKAAGRLVHPNIVTLFDAADIDGLFFLAFEFIDGPDLAQRVRTQPPLTVRDIVALAGDAASALEAAHRVGIIHRDIKPSNLLLTQEGVLKIADFGIASLAGAGSQLTQTGSLIGTPQYLSPEQVNGETPVDGRSDLFSLGVVLYQLFGGRRPFDGSSMAALLYAIVSHEPVDLAQLRPDLPPRLSAAVMRLLAKQPEARFQTAGELKTELGRIERELGASEGERGSEVAPDQAPTMIVSTQRVTELATTHPQAKERPMADLAPPPPTFIEQAAPSRARRRRRQAALVFAALLLAGVGAFAWMKEREKRFVTVLPRQTQQSPPPAIDEPPPTPTVTQPAVLEPSLTEPVSEPAAEQIQMVGGAITISVAPPEAALEAIVKIDGLTRGLAERSVMTLRPGRHVVEVVAKGYEPHRVVVESRDDIASPTNIDVTLQP